jgi:hypothetical protein
VSELVTLQLGRVFSDFRQRVERLRDSILDDGKKIVRREWGTSVRQMFFRTGATLASAQEKVESRGDDRIYTLTPTATSPKGAPYPLFGEYGTGRRGAASGQPAPAGYRYGSRIGMTARRFSRIAIAVAAPQVSTMARAKVKQFAQHVTVN